MHLDSSKTRHKSTSLLYIYRFSSAHLVPLLLNVVELGHAAPVSTVLAPPQHNAAPVEAMQELQSLVERLASVRHVWRA